MCAVVLYCVFMPSSQGEKIYDESADGSRQIAGALSAARSGHKLVLVDFGANWCGWCHVLHSFFNTVPAVKQELADHYVVVLIDVNQQHNAAVVQQYGYPVDLGLPVLMVLDASGRPLATQATDVLVRPDGTDYDSAKVLAFLEKWPAKP